MVNARSSCAKDRKFESQKAGQILHSVANDSSSLQRLYTGSGVVLALQYDAEMGGHRQVVTQFGTTPFWGEIDFTFHYEPMDFNKFIFIIIIIFLVINCKKKFTFVIAFTAQS